LHCFINKPLKNAECVLLDILVDVPVSGQGFATLLVAILSICTCCTQVNDKQINPVLLDTPDFNGMCLSKNNIQVSLKQVVKVPNGITDTDVWLRKYMPERFISQYTFTPGGNKASEDLKSKVAITYEGKYRRCIDLHDGYNVIYYGDRIDEYEDFGVDPTLVVITGQDVSDVLHAYDFSNFSVSQYSKPDELEYTKISVSDVTIEDNILYANICHSTYSSSSGYNAYLVAVDMETQKIKWVTKPLTCNANYYIDEEVIFTGYGFTNEDDYIYICY
jgi:hypothetical protein